MKHKILKLAVKSGIFNAMQLANKNKLTVLCYHRIDDTTHPDFQTFKPNVSATVEGFTAQVEYLHNHFNIVSLDQVTEWLTTGKQDIPDYPALITFDDGYRDNYLNAFPILREKQIPAVIFLATDYIGEAVPFAWDLAAYCFYHTTYDSADLPFEGQQSWQDQKQKDLVLKNWIDQLKYRPHKEMKDAIQRLPEILDVSIPNDAFSKLHLTWDEVREMHKNGIYIGAHTMSHPILTRVSLDKVEHELRGSKERIEAELNTSVGSFAYPNGQLTDFNPEIEQITRNSGFSTAFSLVSGIPSLKNIRENPFAIQRIYIGQNDTFERFVIKVSGISKPKFSF